MSPARQQRQNGGGNAVDGGTRAADLQEVVNQAGACTGGDQHRGQCRAPEGGHGRAHGRALPSRGAGPALAPSGWLQWMSMAVSTAACRYSPVWSSSEWTMSTGKVRPGTWRAGQQEGGGEGPHGGGWAQGAAYRRRGQPWRSPTRLPACFRGTRGQQTAVGAIGAAVRWGMSPWLYRQRLLVHTAPRG